MFKPRLSLSTPLTATIGLGLAGLVLLLVTAFWSLFYTAKIVRLIKVANFSTATQYLPHAQLFPNLASALTLKQSATIESWRLGLELLKQIPPAQEQLTYLGQHFLDTQTTDANLTSATITLAALLEQSKKLQLQLNRSWWLRRSEAHATVQKINDLGSELLTLGQFLSEGEKQILVLLQNTEEIRASGGFMGSYAKITLQSGKVTNLTIQDIYEPDGQFAGFVDAPPGAKEYLSGGRGLRLPDANWQADFPAAAQTIASYFAFSREQELDLLATINVDLVQKMLRVIGDVYLPDYGLTASADNLTDLAHADRNAFFAGSKQKVNFLSSLFTNLKIKLSNLSSTQIQSLLQIFTVALPKKEVQFFAWDSELEQLFINRGVAGELYQPPSANFYFYQVESNVGINKANKNITREVKLDLGEQRSVVTTLFHNSDQTSRLTYINYHRFLLDPESQIQEIVYNQQPITTYDEEVVTSATGQRFKQIGLMVAVPSGKDGELVLSFTHPPGCASANCVIAIQKQSGLPPTPYQISINDQTANLILEQDELFDFHQL